MTRPRRPLVAAPLVALALSLPAPPARASLITDAVTVDVRGAGVGQPGGFDIDLSAAVVVGAGAEFVFRYPQVELQVEVAADTFELRFARTGSSGDLTGPVTWTLGDLDFAGAPGGVVALVPLPPPFGSPLAVESSRVVDGGPSGW